MNCSLEALVVGDEPDAWRAAGFTVTDDAVAVGDVRIVCSADGRGADRWRLRSEEPLPHDVDGIATAHGVGDPPEPVEHRNRVVSLDHVVLRTPDLERTTESMASLGLELRRVRDVSIGGEEIQQRFFRLGNVILEIVGSPTSRGKGPASIWGYAFVVDDLDAAATELGSACSTPKEAVQPGRRIVTVRTRELGIGVTIALMTPHVRGHQSD